MKPLQIRVGYATVAPAACLRVTGEDALVFLQGQFTQELRADRAGAVAYGLLLSQKGKVVADSFILRLSERELVLLSYRVPGAVLRERLEAYVIADDVVIEEETERFGLVSLVGEDARAWLETAVGALPEAGGLARLDDGGLVFRGRRGSGESWEWLAPRAGLPVPPLPGLTSADLERVRLDAGIPAIPEDLGPGDLPNEGGLETSAISYTKGCYLGQEVMARLKAMGQVRRRLQRVTGTGAGPARLPADVYQGGKRVGDVRTWVDDGAGGWLGLSMLSLLSLDASAPLCLSPAGPATVTVVGDP